MVLRIDLARAVLTEATSAAQIQREELLSEDALFFPAIRELAEQLLVLGWSDETCEVGQARVPTPWNKLNKAMSWFKGRLSEDWDNKEWIPKQANGPCTS
jgi:hypothetical protein